MKLKNALACILLLLATAAMFTFALTFARYSEELGSSGSYGSNLDFIVSDQVEVTNSDEFFSAIENGYSNIKISDDADSSIIITGGVSDVTSDLIIDLNGHELQRNNREPMLNVVDGIRLTIVDTSAEQTGCFYNPVGSVLRVGGGTLTVNAGLFESGPRNGRGHNEKAGKKQSEYAENNGGWRTAAGAYVSKNDSFTLYEKNGTDYTPSDSVSMPVIIPAVTLQSYTDGDGAQQTRSLVNGNMYFASAYGGNTYITEDTYLYFTLSDSDAANEQLVVSGSADFYYSYYMRYTEGTGGNPGSYSYVGASSVSENDTLVTIYGYRGVKSSSGSANYAAVQMNSGNIFVRGGEYQTYFGADSTYCIYASGGYMAVEDGSFSALENGVCVNCSYTAAADGDYLRVASGSFYSERGDTVQVSGGNMYVTGGAFEKNATGYAAAQLDDTYTNNSAIAISGGTLEVGGDSGIGFTLSGSYVRGITSTGANSSVTAEDCSFEFTSAGAVGTGSMGIYAESGTVNASGCTFVMPGTNSRGISAAGGTVNINGEYSYFYIDEIDGCYGVYAASNGAVTVNVEAAQFFMGQSATAASDNTASADSVNGAGVYMDAAGGTIRLGDALFVTSGNSVSAVYAERGSITQDDGKLVLVTGAKIPENGYTSGETTFGNLESYTNDIDLVGENRVAYTNAEYAYGVYSGGGSVTLNSVYAAVFGGYSAGLLSTNGGNITVGDIDVTVAINESADYNNANLLSSTAISTEGGSITVNGRADIDTNGLGITARATSSSDAGNITLNGNVDIFSSRGTAIYVNGGNLTLGGDSSSSSTVNITSVTSEEYSWVTPPGVSGAAQTTYHGVYVQGGSLTANSTFNVSHTGVENDNQAENLRQEQRGDWWNGYYNVNIADNQDTLYIDFVTKSFAVYVSGTGNDAVKIQSGTITNEIGGGVYVSGSSSTQVTLGSEGSADNSLLTVSAAQGLDGADPNTDALIANGFINWRENNWDYRQSSMGGSAVEVAGGTLTIYNGTYSTEQGNGILVKNGTANISGGVYGGQDVYEAYGGGAVAGPAASYSFKIFGGTANISGGTFDSNGSGAFIMGTSSDSWGTANISGGSFSVTGQAGISVYEYGELTVSGNTVVSGAAAGLVIESSDNPCTVTIEDGAFTGTRTSNGDGVWCGSTNVTFTVSGGTFTGQSRSGLYFSNYENNGDDSLVSLSGGTFHVNTWDTGWFPNNTGAIGNAGTNIIASGHSASASFDSQTVTIY